jgi:hypothetical protein
MISVGLMMVYFSWKVSPNNVDQSEIYTFAFPTLSFLVGSLIWMIWDPLAREGWMILVIFSFILGGLFQQSATSPVRLGQFWSKFGKKKSK